MSTEDETANSGENYSTPLSEEWQAVERFKNTLTGERDRLARLYRRVEAGDVAGLDPLRELQAAHDSIKKAMPDLARVAPDGAPIDVTPRDLLESYWTQVQQRRNSATTGFNRLNSVLSGGLESKRLFILLGAPNTGKTSFANQVADHIADSGRPVLFVTSEDTPGALFAKTLARVGNVSYTAVLKGWESERQKIDEALTMQRNRKSLDRLRYLDATSGVTMDMIRDKAEAHFAAFAEAKDGGPGVIFVDYVQQIARDIKTMAGLQQDPREVVTLVVKRLRAIAIELDCCVVAISSQNRAGYNRSEANGAIATAKESGEVEYVADVLLALTEDKDKNRIAPPGQSPILLHVDKNRLGEKNKSIPFNFWGARQQFTEVAEV